MRIRQILLVHPNRSIRALIKKFVFAELSDVEFFETENGSDALNELNMNPFDVVIVTTSLIDMPAVELKAKLAQTAHNEMTPFIVLSEDDNGTDRQRLMQLGFQHVVLLRVRPADLIAQINEACDPRKWRKDKRYYIPKAEVLIDARGQTMEATLINISRGGILIELISFTPELLMESDLLVTLRIAERTDVREPRDLPCRLLRVNVTEWQPNSCPAAMRVTFAFADLDSGQTAAIEGVLQLAVEDKLQEE